MIDKNCCIPAAGWAKTDDPKKYLSFCRICLISFEIIYGLKSISALAGYLGFGKRSCIVNKK
jgi:hypothetical protein